MRYVCEERFDCDHEGCREMVYILDQEYAEAEGWQIDLDQVVPDLCPVHFQELIKHATESTAREG